MRDYKSLKISSLDVSDFPFNVQRRAPTPEQRSVLQSPMQQSPPSREPEQRNDLNSPVSYQRPPPMERPVSRQQSHREER